MNMFQKVRARYKALSVWIAKSPFRELGMWAIVMWLGAWFQIFRHDPHTLKNFLETGAITFVSFTISTTLALLIVPWVYFKMFPGQLKAAQEKLKQQAENLADTSVHQPSPE